MYPHLEGRRIYHLRMVDMIQRRIDHRDAKAKEAYNASQRDVHNLYTKAWPELTEEQRNKWRVGCGIQPV